MLPWGWILLDSYRDHAAIKILMSQLPRHQRLPSSSTSAFTVIELLVVIAILAILAGLLLPALSRAKGTGHRIRCVSNIRQILLAHSIYVGDHGTFPLFYYETENGVFWWVDTLQPYIKAAWEDDIYHCPGFPWKNAQPPRILRSGNGGRGSYDMNDVGGYTGVFTSGPIDPEIAATGSLGLGGSLNNSRQFRALSESKVAVPSEMIAFGDAFVTQRMSLVNGYFDIGVYLQRRMFPPINDDALSRERKRHNGLWNVGFCDGHIETLKPVAIFNRSDGVVRRWNYDNKPHREFMQP
jgi:prepilin-type N-terminal cleavage/methylation domain-containing protein/prepilin-type processing-associated H-X9-DG protein